MATTPVLTVPDVQKAIQSALNQVKADVSLTTDIGAVAGAVTEVMKFFQSPAGQKTIESWITNSNAFNDKVSKGWDAFIGLFK